VARKLLAQVWHLLSGNPPTALEADKSLPANISDCVLELQCRMFTTPTSSP